MIEIRLSGSGGQGLITAGIILAEAAVLEGKEVIQSQSYGPEARGGASKAEVIISDAPINHPKVLTPSIALAMTQEACDKYTKDLADNALLIIDDTLVTRIPQNQGRIIKIPITQLAKQQLGNSLYANIVALGVLVGASHVVSSAAITEAVINRFPPHTRDKNIQALKLGFTSAAQCMSH